MKFLIAEDGLPFDGRSLESGPLGGVETAVILLAEALAARGHEVEVRTRIPAPLTQNGVDWVPMDAPPILIPDVMIASRVPALFRLAPHAPVKLMWLHGPGRYLRKWRHLKHLLRHRPTPVVTSHYHATTLLWWIPLPAPVLIPLAPAPLFTTAQAATNIPGPRAIFMSNPQRSLDWILDVWETRLHSAKPDATLHVFCGSATYGGLWADRMAPLLARAKSMEDKGVLLRAPVSKPELVEELRATRVMIYRGDMGETYCLAAAEAQAMGVPLVTCGIGSLAERVHDGETGFIRSDVESFSKAALDLLNDDSLWQAQHAAALAHRTDWTWAHIAGAFEKAAG